MEHWEYLKPGGYCFVYDDALFRPGTDSFLLSAFPKTKPGLCVCDLGCGTGLLGLLLLQRQPELLITGVELQPAAVRLARLAAEKNNLSDRMTIHLGDLRTAALPAGSFDLIVCNPPYYPVGSGKLPADAAFAAARSEQNCSLEELCQTAARLLRWGGRFCLVHKPERLTDLCCALRSVGLEPKRIRFVAGHGKCAPSLLLLEACRGGKPGLKVEDPLLLQDANGMPSTELDIIYFRKQEAIL